MSKSNQPTGQARHKVEPKDGKLAVIDLAAAAQGEAAALPAWLRSGPEAAVAHVEEVAKGLHKDTLALIRDLAGAVAAMRDLAIFNKQ